MSTEAEGHVATSDLNFVLELTEHDTRNLAAGNMPPGLVAYARVLVSRHDRNKARGITVEEPKPWIHGHHRVLEVKDSMAPRTAPARRGLNALFGDAARPSSMPTPPSGVRGDGRGVAPEHAGSTASSDKEGSAASTVPPTHEEPPGTAASEVRPNEATPTSEEQA